MKIFRKLFIVMILLSTLFSFNAFAMSEKEYADKSIETPQNEMKYDDRALNYRWTWINNDLCVRFNLWENVNKTRIEDLWSRGMTSRWIEFSNGKYQAKTRDTYSGMWHQAADGIRSFTFDDDTIPVGVTKIDGVIYAFNTYGELKEGYEYYTGFKTEVDGIVKADSTEFIQWLGTQYIPDCTSHE